MRVLLIHADRFSYHVTEKTSAVSKLAELDESTMKGSVDEALVAFLASEKTDERNIESVATQAAKTNWRVLGIILRTSRGRAVGLAQHPRTAAGRRLEDRRRRRGSAAGPRTRGRPCCPLPVAAGASRMSACD